MKKEKSAPKPVLVFNHRKKLVAIVGSVYEVSKLTGVGPGNISRVCNGDLISSGQMYFRYIDDSIEIELSDVNNLKVDDYDEMCGTKRKLYGTINMNRKGWKYNSSNTKNKNCNEN